MEYMLSKAWDHIFQDKFLSIRERKIFIFNSRGTIIQKVLLWNSCSCIKKLNLTHKEIVDYLNVICLYLQEEEVTDYGDTIKISLKENSVERIAFPRNFVQP